MIDSKKINEDFSFIIADDDENKIYMNQMFLELNGITPKVITGGDYLNRLIIAIKGIHAVSKYPIIFLDENFEASSRINGTEIATNLVNGFKKQGGIIFPFSSTPENQLDSWNREIKDSRAWKIVNDTRIPYEFFTTGDIHEICDSFSENISYDESDTEIKIS